MNKPIVSTCLVVALLQFSLPSRAEDSVSTESGWVPHLEVRAGYTGSFWSPRGIEPYQVNTYGRSMAYAELAVVHPLLILSEALDVIEMPSLRIETNMGYSAESGELVEILPDAVRENPYLSGSGWLTFFQFVSLRYRSERFHAAIQDPRAFSEGYTGEGVYKVENQLRDVEVGLIGSPDGRLHETMIEIGVFRTWMTRPTLTTFNATSGTEYPNLLMFDARYDGVYMALNTAPQPDIWPLETQVMLRLGAMLGVELRLSFDRPVWHG
ncbi:MAG: hypothetical protein V2A56_09770, partial [bacterium]